MMAEGVGLFFGGRASDYARIVKGMPGNEYESRIQVRNSVIGDAG